MYDRLSGVVFPTDRGWFDHFRPNDQRTVIDEVNFWRPSAETMFRALGPGEPFFFRLKAPENKIAGFGIFAAADVMPVSAAWDIFAESNGASNRTAFEERIMRYRSSFRRSASTDGPLSCIILREAVFLPSSLWMPWGFSEEWKPSIVGPKSYDMRTPPGDQLWDFMVRTGARTPPELNKPFALVAEDRRDYALGTVARRVGQGTFRLRLRLLKAYGNQCAITGEHATPVLDAAHIQPYRGPESNHVQNGIIVRKDIHKLFDDGYVSVDPDLRFVVSRRLRDEFENGNAYYALEGRELIVPKRLADRPSRDALRWHLENRFLA